jgi:hypothetical protein
MSRAIRTCLLALGFGALLGASSVPPVEAFSDLVCPGATEPVRAFNALKRDQSTPVDAMIASLKRIMETYDRCAVERFTDNAEAIDEVTLSVGRGIEGAHYAKVRSAQFAVVLGRLYRLLEEYGAARASFERANALVESTIEFKQSTQTAYRSNNIHVGASSSHRASSDTSNYREAALQIREAARAELARLPKPSSPSPSS